MKLRTKLLAAALSLVMCTGALITASPISSGASDIAQIPSVPMSEDYIYAEHASYIYDYIVDLDNYELDPDTGKYTSMIDIRALNLATVSDAHTFFQSFRVFHTELFFIGSSWSVWRDSTYKPVALSLTLYADKETVKEDIRRFNEETDKIIASVPTDLSDAEKALFLHEYIVLNTRYNEDVLNNTNAEPESVYCADGVILDGNAVCQGYAYAYRYLLGRVGVYSEVVNSDAVNHAWNIVLLDGKWYHVDTTWDDPTWDMVGRVMHKNFLVSSETFASGKHSAWNDLNATCQTTTSYDITDKSYEDNTLFGLETPVCYANGYWYYSDPTSARKTTITRTSDILSDTPVSPETIKEVSYVFYADESGSYWLHSISISIHENKIYYVTDSKIFCCDLDGANETLLYTYEKPSMLHNMYGLYIKNNTVYYNIVANLNEKRTTQREMYSFELPINEPVKPSDTSLTVADGVIFGIPTGMKPKELMSMLDGNYVVMKGDEIVTSGYIGTGYTVCRVVNGEITDSVTVSIVGDIYGDGITNSKDILAVKLSLSDQFDADKNASDVNGDGVVDATDISALAQKALTDAK